VHSDVDVLKNLDHRPAVLRTLPIKIGHEVAGVVSAG
jgi:D-arabinose 1-dehydrogenase-like Zn-dependent alcohol dehydrogenase